MHSPSKYNLSSTTQIIEEPLEIDANEQPYIYLKQSKFNSSITNLIGRSANTKGNLQDNSNKFKKSFFKENGAKNGNMSKTS